VRDTEAKDRVVEIVKLVLLPFARGVDEPVVHFARGICRLALAETRHNEDDSALLFINFILGGENEGKRAREGKERVQSRIWPC